MLLLANRCGIGPFTTGPNDPMIKACQWHDQFYIENKLHGKESLRAYGDSRFYDKMKSIAKNNLLLRIQAIIYYALARLFGWIPWYLRRSNGK